mmetsp:Transcript_20131/g.25954  ORF Transcript_20131/g.25954 Transcript_20131/m.25954 type:complete len:131 (+) Transcript_20131:150-542(+)|eukprot:CAMPEP_0198137464 /NCGR_PEP_ID=MMETSP1443-20131203/938_1 /TAXON_ID=186043 /ORGANISM="Entomoneis sp., Strain CCMP2396" /LENGTH=130 /DNA_ID=CAMNT_0043798889 /DNA_START=124 /DNA_END=516 /DNA_ORIENTATION=+
MFVSLFIALFALESSVEAFSVLPRQGSMKTRSKLSMADTWDGASSSSSSGQGSLEQIEFKIYADGRIEESVRGIKGGNCHKVTDKINEMLGEVVAIQPSEEMFEQEVVTDQTLYQSESDGSEWNGGSSSW